ncbi:hypothetical protein SNE40_000100 [Patella caerulea]|uniref:Peroxidase n=1 Tax=Patella caerulea TaxID=87958 RepID=A0AAN8Q167_PATCE
MLQRERRQPRMNKGLQIVIIIQCVTFSLASQQNQAVSFVDAISSLTNTRNKRHVITRSKSQTCSYQNVQCSPFERYRQPDGRCNNLKIPYWGAAGTDLRRLIDNHYDDGVGSPRTRGVGGELLCSTRKISNALVDIEVKGAVDTIHTNLFQVYGQFLDHDIDFSPNIKGPDKSRIKCCTDIKSQQSTGADTNGACFPIEIPIDDPYFKPRRCMNFVRTVTVEDPKLKCKSGAREQKNTITSYIDGSSVYGSSEEQQKKLRQFQNGLLKVGVNDMLSEDVDGDCVKRNATDFCLLAGDSRVNEHPGLSAFHTIFVKLHNRIAKQLRRLNIRNQLWNDEKLFQETRRIIAAILQHITYNEWLPHVVGAAATQKYRIKTTFGVMHRYDNSLDARIINSFSTAAFRYGHSSIPNAWSYGNVSKLLVEMFNSPFFIVDHKGEGLNLIVEGMLKDSSQDTDLTFSDGVKNKLFQNFTVPGLDLAALNIQRGRDHGLAPYNKYRKHCGLKPISFDGSTAQVRALERVYSHVDDVDLFIGGVTESAVYGGVVGPTFACIIAQQFHNLKYGDRFWFENLRPPTPYLRGNPIGFTIGQITAIRRVSMGRILCDTTDIKRLPRKAFLHPNNGRSNRLVSCKDFRSLPALDIKQWYQSIFG